MIWDDTGGGRQHGSIQRVYHTEWYVDGMVCMHIEVEKRVKNTLSAFIPYILSLSKYLSVGL